MSRDEVDVLGDLTPVKAIGIFLVVLDHNDAIRRVIPTIFPALTVHVIAFFFVSYVGVLRNNDDWPSFLRKRWPRYLIPFLVFYLLATVGQMMLGGWPGGGAWMLGILQASMGSIKNGCGMAVLWFLPSLMVFVVLCKWQRTRRRLPKSIVWVLSASAVLMPGALGAPAFWAPWGMGAACYALAVCVVSMACLTSIRSIQSVYLQIGIILLMAVLLFGFMAVQSMDLTLIEVGTHDLPGIDAPIDMARIFGINVFGIVVLVLCSPRLASLRCVRILGDHSIEIFLMHQFVMVPMLKVANHYSWLESQSLFVGVVTIAFALLVPVMVARGGRRTMPSLHRWVFHGGR